MKWLARIQEFTSLLFNKPDGDDVEIKPASRAKSSDAEIAYDLPDGSTPVGDANDTLVLAAATQTLTNKSIDADLNTITNIDNADIKAAAAIEFSKMEALTLDRALITDGSGEVVPSDVTAAEIAHLDGVTGGIQGQLDSMVEKAGDTMTGNLTLSGANIVMGGAETVDGRDVSVDGATLDTAVSNISTNASNISTNASNISANTSDIADLRTTTGTVDGDTDLGTFTGATIPASSSVKSALQSLVTAHETHTADTSVHGVSGDVVGTTDAQTLTNKTLTALKYSETTVSIAANTFATASETILRVTAGAGPLNTISGAADGDVKIVVNETGSDLIVSDDNAAGGFYTGAGADITVKDNGSITVIYDSTSSRWNIIGGASGSGGGLTLATIDDTDSPVSASSNTHYLTDSSSGVIAVSLPVGVSGSVIRFTDASSTWNTNNVTLTPDGAETIDGAANLILDVQGTWVQLMWNGTEWVTDDAIVPQSIDITGDLSVGGTVSANKGLITQDSATIDLTIASGYTLTHPFLTIESGVTYTNNGQMHVAGDLLVSGTLIDNGIILN